MWLLNTLLILSVLGVIYGDAEVTTEDEVKIEYEVEIEDAVLILTTDNFESIIKDNEFVLVEFYAPWCGHCKSLAPEYAKAAKEFEEIGSNIKLGKVDATQEKKLAKDFGVRGYPTLKFFRSGKPIEYTGGRRAEDIVKWLNKETETADAEVTSNADADADADADVDVDADADADEEDAVLVLTTENFESVIKDNEFVLVEFYAPWCGHCQSLAPEYAKAAKELEEKRSNIKLGKVDATEETKLGEDFGVSGYPTLKFFRSGTPIEYTGGRQAEEIVKWLNKKSGPPAVDLETVDAAEEFIKSEPVVVIGFFKDRESAEAKTFLSVADAVDDYPFGIASNEEIYAKYEAKSDSIILFKSFDEGKAVFDGESTEEAIKKFLTVESTPLINEFTFASARKIFSGDIDNHLLFFVSKEAAHIEKYVEPAKYLAKQFRNEVLFVTINADEDDYQRILAYFGVKKEEIPLMRLTRLEESMEKYKPEDAELSPENIQSFVQDLLDGKLKKYLLSQELPEDWDKTPVKTLVSTNFDEVTLNTDKYVFVQFYAPPDQCPLCEQVAPIFDQLGELYKDNDTFVIAKIDGTANELEHTKIVSFPTFRLYRTGDNHIFIYNNVATLEEFTKFLENGGIEEEADDDDSEVSFEIKEALVDSEESNEEEESVEEEEVPRDEL